MTEKLLVFDCFGVVVDEVAPPWLEQYFTPEKAVAVKADIVKQADFGDITEQEMFERLGALVGQSWQQARAGWLELAMVRPGMPELLRELRAETKIVMLSDAPNTFLYRVLEQGALTDLFSKIYVSSELHLTKPDPAIFRHVLTDQGVSPKNALMIDDRRGNVRGAESVGMQGLLFDFNSTAAFARELKQRFLQWGLPA